MALKSAAYIDIATRKKSITIPATPPFDFLNSFKKSDFNIALTLISISCLHSGIEELRHQINNEHSDNKDQGTI